jgi:hypothetical protein
MRLIKRMLVASTLVGAFFILFAGNAFAASAPTSVNAGPHEGSGGNNIVCNGVPSKAVLMYYVNGGTDSCGHHDIASIWKSQGITPQVASMMHAGQVCSSQGLQSTGRHHSPNPALDRRMTINGTTFYVRPLAVWGSTCYSAWIGTTEDGRLVAVLMGCGNSEVTLAPPASKPLPKPRKPKKTITNSFNCTGITTVSQTGSDFVLRVVTKTTGNAKFAGVSWSPAPSSTIDTRTAQFHAASSGTVTIVAVAKFTVGVHSVKSVKCVKLVTVATPPAAPTPPAAACITTNGTPLFSPLPSGVTVVNGICTTVTTTTVQTCGEGFHESGHDNNGNVICISNTNTNVVTVPITVVVTPPAPCGCTTPPPPTPAPTPSAFVSFNAIQEVHTNESRANTCAQVTTSESMTVQFRADLGTFSGMTPSTVSGTQLVCATYTGPSEPGTDIWHVQVFDNGKLITDATKSITIIPVPNPNI